MPTPVKFFCWSCKKEVTVEGRISRNDTCPHCDQSLKCCYNCRFYDRNAYHQCTEPQAEWVRYKEKANFCSWFTAGPPPVRELKPAAGEKKEPEADPKVRQKTAWDKLFRE